MLSRTRTVLSLIAEAGSIFALLFLFLGGANRDFLVPLYLNGDALEYLMQVKGTIENGWWWVHPRLSAPGVFEQVQFPSNTTIDQVIVWVVHLFTHEPGLVINLSWMIMVVLSGLIARRCLVLLGISPSVARAAGLLYAFSPYALMRNINHFSLAIYLVPIPCAVALLVATGRWRPLSPGHKWALGIGCVLVGFNYPYYAFFACFLILLAAFFALASDPKSREFGSGLLMVGVICLATGVNLAPSFYSWSQHGRPASTPEKRAAEAEQYGLKIRQLVSPGRDNALPWLRNWALRESSAQYPLENENASTRLGLVGTLGFVALLTGIFVPGIGALFEDGQLFLNAARLMLATVLLGTIGGFGSLFNLLVAPDIRAYNRVAPFIAFLCFVALAMLAEAFLRRAAASRARQLATAGTVALTLFIGLIDQAQVFRSLNAMHRPLRDEWLSLSTFVNSLEGRLAGDAMVFQLPAVTFLNETGRERMTALDHIKLYLPSNRLRWSYPAISNDVVRWQQQVSRLPTGILVSALIGEGFTAILIDRYGYPDQAAALLSELGVTTGSQAILVADERYVALDLRRVKKSDVATDRLPRVGDTPRPATLGLPRCVGDTPQNLEWVGVTAIPFNQPHVDVPLAGDFFVTGWAVDRRTRGVAGDVDIVVGDNAYPAFYGIERADVADALKVPGYRPSGYTARLMGSEIGTGLQPLSIRILANDRSCYYQGERVWIEAEAAPSIAIDGERME
jgi:phosphoglycerol transferase